MKVLIVNIFYNLSVLCDNKIFENQQYLLSCNQVPQQSLTGDNFGLYVALFVGDFNKVGDTQIQNYDSWDKWFCVIIIFFSTEFKKLQVWQQGIP